MGANKRLYRRFDVEVGIKIFRSVQIHSIKKVRLLYERNNKKEAKEKNLRFIQRIQGTNLSQTILIMERYEEFEKVKYYVMEFTDSSEFLR